MVSIVTPIPSVDAPDVAANARRGAMGEMTIERFREVEGNGDEDTNIVNVPTIAIAAKILDHRHNLHRKFTQLIADWHSERDGLASDPTMLTMCAPYQKIIAMGPEVIPLILNEMRRKPDHWFWALYVLTNANPVAPEHEGLFSEMVSDWLTWGKDNGFILAAL